MIEDLIYWCREREEIRKRKLAGRPAPWTDDPILTRYRFCNVHRRDDRVSTWLRENVLTEQNIEYNLRSFLMFSALARWLNWPPTIKAIMDAGLYPRKRVDWVKIGKLIDTLGKKQKVWTGAYMIRAPKKAGMKKGKFVSEVVVGKNFGAMVPRLIKGLQQLTEPAPTYQGTWVTLQEIDGYGSFMAGQIAGDWTYTSLLGRAPDLNTFAPMGPGSVRGFNRMMGNEKINKRPPEDLWLQKLGEWRAQVIEALGPEYADLTALDIQNTLCETDKLLRVRNEEGRPRANYRTHAEEY